MKCFLFLLLVLVTFISCKNEVTKHDIKDNYQIVLKKSGPENYRTIDTMRFRTFVEKDKRIYEYKSLDSDNTYFYMFEINTINDSILKIIDVECKLIDKVDFQFKNKNITIYKYAYDLVGMMDEESDYYFSKEFGLIMIESTAWSKVNVLINEQEFNPIQDSIFKYSYKFKSSYPPPTMIDTE
jgi:hypothetical protein